jgi:hypothetical protein
VREGSESFQLTEYLSDYYVDNSTTICGESVILRNGVKQGDTPPLLFNYVIDEVLEGIDDDVGYRLQGERVSKLAFARPRTNDG